MRDTELKRRNIEERRSSRRLILIWLRITSINNRSDHESKDKAFLKVRMNCFNDNKGKESKMIPRLLTWENVSIHYHPVWKCVCC